MHHLYNIRNKNTRPINKATGEPTPVADLHFEGPDALTAVGPLFSLTVGHSRLVAESLKGKGLSASYQGIYIFLSSMVDYLTLMLQCNSCINNHWAWEKPFNLQLPIVYWIQGLLIKNSQAEGAIFASQRLFINNSWTITQQKVHITSPRLFIKKSSRRL